MPYASLSIDLKAQLANLQSGMDKAVRLAEKDAARMEKAFASVKAAAGAIGGALAAGLSVSAVTSFITSTNDALLAIKDLAEGTGSSVEQISALENALRANNRTLDEAQPILVKLNGALKEADGKNALSQAFKNLGLSVEELRRLDPVDALQQVGKALQGFDDDATRAAYVQEIFGKSVAEVIPLLNDLADSQLKATDGIRAATEEADKFEKNLASLTASVTELSRELAGPLVSGLNSAFSRFKAAREVFGSYSKAVAETLGKEQFLDAGEGVAFYSKQLAKLQQIRAAVAAGPGGKSDFGALRLADFDKQIAQAQKLEQFYRKVFAAGAADLGQSDPRELARRGRGVLPSLPDVLGDKPGARVPRALPGPRDFIGPEIPESLADALRAIQDTDFNKVAALNAQLQELLAVERAGGASPAVAEAIAKTREQLEKLDPAAQKAAEEAKRLQDILNDTPSGAFKAVLSDIELINRAFERGAIDAETWAEAVKRASEPLRKGGTGSAEGDDIGKQLGLSFQSAAEDAIVFGKKAGDVIRSLEQDILRLVTRKYVTKPLLDALDGLLGGKDGIDLGKLAGSALSGLFGGLPSFDVGSDFVPRDMIAKVHRGERIVPAAENRGGGRAMAVTQHFHFAGPAADRRTQQQLATAAGQAVQRSLARNG